jgi:hypothetical protein
MYILSITLCLSLSLSHSLSLSLTHSFARSRTHTQCLLPWFSPAYHIPPSTHTPLPSISSFLLLPPIFDAHTAHTAHPPNTAGGARSVSAARGGGDQGEGQILKFNMFSIPVLSSDRRTIFTVEKYKMFAVDAET